MVHTFTSLGIHIAVDVNSGAVHILDEPAYRILQLQEEPMEEICPADLCEKISCGSEETAEAWSELYKLQKEGLLFSDDEYIDPQAAQELKSNAPVKALCLHVSHDCNLRCKYCFASTGDFGTGRRINMNPETARKAIDFVVDRSGERRNIEVDFFGGEPLLAMDTVRETVDYARSLEEKAGKNFRFTITTNGLLLDREIDDYINENMSNCVLSIDGRKEVNDAMRVTAGGKGSYDTIIPKFRELVKDRDADYYLRGTFTRSNLDFSADVLHMIELGFTNISVEPAVGSPDSDWAVREEDLPRVLDEYEKLAEALKDRPEIIFFHFQVDLSQGPCIIKRLRGCGAGCEYVAVTPEGDIYPCHQFVGNTQYRLGSVLDNTFDIDKTKQFADLNVYTRPECRDCWARFYCSGGCSASNFLVNGDIRVPNKVACEMERKRLECAIAIKAYRDGE